MRRTPLVVLTTVLAATTVGCSGGSEESAPPVPRIREQLYDALSAGAPATQGHADYTNCVVDALFESVSDPVYEILIASDNISERFEQFPLVDNRLITQAENDCANDEVITRFFRVMLGPNSAALSPEALNCIATTVTDGAGGYGALTDAFDDDSKIEGVFDAVADSFDSCAVAGGVEQYTAGVLIIEGVAADTATCAVGLVAETTGGRRLLGGLAFGDPSSHEAFEVAIENCSATP